MSIYHIKNRMRRITGAILGLMGFVASGLSYSVPVDVSGVILGATERGDAISALGVVATLPANTEVIGFDLSMATALLGQDPFVFRIFDDGSPASGPDVSGGPFTGVDVDAVGGRNNNGALTWASEVTFMQFGPEVTPAVNTIGEFHDPNVDGLLGDSVVEGFPGNVLGPADASISFSVNIDELINFTSIGSGGILEIAFPSGIADANLVGNFDLFLFEVGAANDIAFFQVDIETTNVPEPMTVFLIMFGLAGLGFSRGKKL